jgi:hypothetical protein
VVPFGVAGTERIMPPFLKEYSGQVIAGIPAFVRRGRLAGAFGDSLTLAPDEASRAFVARLQETCFALTGEAEQTLGGQLVK